MTIQECYRQLGGDFAQAQKRLPSERLISRFLVKFPDDSSFSSLCAAMEEGDRDKAFRAAHTLKGVSGSLSLERLFSSASRLTELLRPEAEEIPASAHSLFEEVQQDYRLAVQVIRSYSASWGPEGGPCPPPNGFDQSGCSLHDS